MPEADGKLPDHSILEGPQGAKKSIAIKTLFDPWFTGELADLIEGQRDADAGVVPGTERVAAPGRAFALSSAAMRRVRTLLYEAANFMLTRYKGPLKLK